MEKFSFGIIGGTGGIGRRFADFLRQEGHAVHVTGRRTGMDMPDLAMACQVIVVSVPIGVTCEVIRKVGPFLKEDALLMDLTSLKEEPVRVMLASSASEVIGCHPLFGPGVSSLEGQNIALCPGRGERWLPRLKALLQGNGARVVVTTPQRHDEIMAIVQGLNHLNTIALGLVLNETGMKPSELEEFTTPIYRMKMEIMERVFGRPELYAELLTLNPHVKRICDLYEKKIAELRQHIIHGDAGGLRACMERCVGFQEKP
ncbi:MAG TPA: prephenate dehydrogenase/arogenate dehydrogenase family protein [Syntrophales bacterium]|nr:prephenate dehydrogenase/arogenate dehydrogenase family protein [Syntrophales bacterium]HPI57104.1 prephenate dehydrogenase/arogenate dehydrogenase family protein [Syntrophales bacterium]HQM30096.1 prephenate dehydrogenase/arogenate dehydrogenase family protein [Syntrophales bacterium]